MTDAPPPATENGLFSPITLRGVTARNRVVVSPMCQYRSDHGGPTDWHMVQLGRYALGGAGIVFGEETAVEARGRKTHHCAGIWDDSHMPQYRRLTDFIRAHGAVPAMQIGHAGRKASVHAAIKDWAPLTEANAEPGHPPWQGLAPSAIPVGPEHHLPRAMDLDDIRVVTKNWARAARRAEQAGYEILEIHGAHGYLLHQFLSPLTNHRTDAYGGDLASRMRFPLHVAEAVRAAWPADKPLFYRVSAVDGQGGAWTIDDTVALSRELAARGIDVIDCSSGGITGDTDMPIVKRVAGYQVPFAARVRAEADIMTMAVGLITGAHQADAIIRDGQADLIALARELIWNPNWPVHAAQQLGIDTAYDLMPADFAHRLHRRDHVAKLPINQGGEADAEQVRLIEST